MAHGGIADQALSAWAPTVEPQHVGGDGGFVDKYEVGRVKKALFAYPAPARASHVCSFALCRRPQAFLTVMPWRAKKRDSALRLPGIRRL